MFQKEEKKIGEEPVFEERMAENFLKIMKDPNPENQSPIERKGKKKLKDKRIIYIIAKITESKSQSRTSPQKGLVTFKGVAFIIDS